MIRSASPSSAIPRSAPSARTAARIASGCSAPQPSLMFRPSGETYRATTVAPAASNAAGAAWNAAPFAASMTTLRPSSRGGASRRGAPRRRGRDRARRLRARSAPAPPPRCGARSRARPRRGACGPRREKIFTPLSGHGLCEAETTTPASAPSSRASHATAGVGTTPAKRTMPPAFVSPPVSAQTIPPEDSRVSHPTTTEGSGWPERGRERRADARDRRGVERRLARFPADSVGAEQPAHSARCYVERGAPRAPERREEAQCLGDVVDAYENGPRPAARAQTATAASDSGRRSETGAPATVPRNALRDAPTTRGTPGGASRSSAPRECEVLLGRLAEPEAGVEEDFLCWDSGGERALAGFSDPRPLPV